MCQTLQQTGLFVCLGESSTARILIVSSATLSLSHALHAYVSLQQSGGVGGGKKKSKGKGKGKEYGGGWLRGGFSQ